MDKISGLGLNPIQKQLNNMNMNQDVKNAPETNFKDLFQSAIQKVDSSQKQSELLTKKLMTGEIEDLHTVMIASQKAQLSLQLTVQVRNKVVEAYQEIMRMQM